MYGWRMRWRTRISFSRRRRDELSRSRTFSKVFTAMSSRERRCCATHQAKAPSPMALPSLYSSRPTGMPTPSPTPVPPVRRAQHEREQLLPYRLVVLLGAGAAAVGLWLLLLLRCRAREPVPVCRLPASCCCRAGCCPPPRRRRSSAPPRRLLLPGTRLGWWWPCCAAARRRRRLRCRRRRRCRRRLRRVSGRLRRARVARRGVKVCDAPRMRARRYHLCVTVALARARDGRRTRHVGAGALRRRQRGDEMVAVAATARGVCAKQRGGRGPLVSSCWRRAGARGAPTAP